MCNRKKLSLVCCFIGMYVFLAISCTLAQHKYPEIERYRARLQTESRDSNYHKALTLHQKSSPLVAQASSALQKRLHAIVAMPKNSVAELALVIEKLELLLQDAVKKQDWEVELQTLTELFTNSFWQQPKNYRKAFIVAVQLKQRLAETYHMQFDVSGEAYVKLAEAYYIFKDYAMSIQLLAYVMDKSSQSFKDCSQLEALRISGICYANMPGGMLKSDSCFTAMLDYTEMRINRPVYDALALSNLACNAMLQGDFDKALALNQEVLPRLKQENDYGHIAGMYACQGRCYLGKADYTMLRSIIDSLQLYAHKDYYNPNKRFKQVYALSGKYYSAMGEAVTAQRYHDSLVNIYKMEEQEYASQFISDARREVRDMEISRSKQQILRQRNIIVGVLIVLFILSIVIMLIVWLYRKRNAAYKVLARKAEEWARESTSSQGLAVAETSSNSFKKKVTEEDRQIMTCVAQKMRVEQVYRESDLTMDSLAERLGVSRHSLSGAINRSTGANFYQYINSFRIKEAVTLISENDHKELYVDELYGRVGFNNRTTFYRVFKQLTGLSPTEFQKNQDRT